VSFCIPGAVILDLYSRKVVGWSLSKSLETDVVADAFFNVVRREKNIRGVFHHSDRGSQYSSKCYQQILALFGTKVSTIRKGNCWDNSPCESFFATLKWEMVASIFDSHCHARNEVEKYIRYYNYERIHSSLKYKTPHEVHSSSSNRFSTGFESHPLETPSKNSSGGSSNTFHQHIDLLN
jgi:putative transposase